MYRVIAVTKFSEGCCYGLPVNGVLEEELADKGDDSGSLALCNTIIGN